MIHLPRVHGGYSVIVTDNPWSYRDKGSRMAPDSRKQRGRGRGYETMTLRDICDMGPEVMAAAARDALLFSWCTSSHLVDGSGTLAAREWGFEPKTTMEWVKIARPALPPRWIRSLTIGLRDGAERPRELAQEFAGWAIEALTPPRLRIVGGHYVRGAHEHVIIARRGKARIPEALREPSVFFAELTGVHSGKPEILQDIIERMLPDSEGRRLELFSRRRRPGWDGWGNEYPQILLPARAASLAEVA